MRIKVLRRITQSLTGFLANPLPLSFELAVACLTSARGVGEELILYPLNLSHIGLSLECQSREILSKPPTIDGCSYVGPISSKLAWSCIYPQHDRVRSGDLNTLRGL